MKLGATCSPGAALQCGGCGLVCTRGSHGRLPSRPPGPAPPMGTLLQKAPLAGFVGTSLPSFRLHGPTLTFFSF